MGTKCGTLQQYITTSRGFQYSVNIKYDLNDEEKIINYIPLSQQEIADINKMSKLKTNRLLRDLIEGGFVCPYQNKRGKYEITEKGHKVLRLIQKKNT